MKNLVKIERILKKHKEYLRNKFYIERIGVFGSYSKGTQKKKSDIDIYPIVFSSLTSTNSDTL